MTLIGLVYISLPIPQLPPPPPGSRVSQEPADTESSYRQAYFTNLSRQEVMDYYQHTFPQSLRLNHPPEEAVEFIRDQTKSSWLEELVYPLKTNLYINGFYPTKPTEQINLEGIHYAAKITWHVIPSTLPTRLTVIVLACGCSLLLIKETIHA